MFGHVAMPPRGLWVRLLMLLSIALVVPACEFVDGEETGSSAPGGGQPVMTCSDNPDPLATGTPVTDAHDCLFIDLAQRYAHPDPMLLKAQVQQESAFNLYATSSDSPCGVPTGWTDVESKSFGLLQITPACNEATSILLPNGHPNLTRDQTSSLWQTSVYNPARNLEEGVKTITRMLSALRQSYAGCSEPQYALMSAGAFNSGLGSVLGCGMYNARAQLYVAGVLSHYRVFSTMAGWPYRY